MSSDFSIIPLVLGATLVVQLVMAGLLLVSLVSWTVIFAKVFGLRRVKNRNDGFEREFWSGKSLTELNQAAQAKADSSPPTQVAMFSISGSVPMSSSTCRTLASVRSRLLDRKSVV